MLQSYLLRKWLQSQVKNSGHKNIIYYYSNYFQNIRIQKRQSILPLVKREKKDWKETLLKH